MSKLDSAYAAVANYYRVSSRRRDECQSNVFPLLEKAVNKVVKLKTSASKFWIIDGEGESFRAMIRLELDSDYYLEFELFFDAEGVDTGIMVYIHDYAGTVRHAGMFLPGDDCEAFKRAIAWIKRKL